MSDYCFLTFCSCHQPLLSLLNFKFLNILVYTTQYRNKYSYILTANDQCSWLRTLQQPSFAKTINSKLWMELQVIH